MTVRDVMAVFDRRILRSRIVKDLADFGTATGVEGAFHMQPRVIELPHGGVVGVALSFDTRASNEISQLQLNDPFTIQGHGTYRFLRELVPGGDESGLTIIELGENLP